MITFENCDCMEALRKFPDKFFDLAIVDPPYGDANGGNAERFGERLERYKRPFERGGCGHNKYGHNIIKWDVAPPREYARKQTADTIEKFARIELPRTEDEEEKHMEKFNPAEIIKAMKEQAPEVLPVPTKVETITRLERENADLRHVNDELTAQLAQYENGNVTKADAILILKVALRMLEA